jgi:hypothetical protein
MNRARLMGTLALLLIAAPTQAPAQSGGYTAWKYNEEQKRYECQYLYPNTKGGTTKHLVVVYPKGSPQAGWAYYHNPAGTAWGRCAIKGNEKYDPNVMHWQQLNKAGDGYEDYKDKPPGYCPTAKEGKAPVPLFPDPPS